MTNIESLFSDDKELKSLLLKISDAAETTGTEIYLVGGLIRDKFLERKTKDIDITTIGDGIGFAEQLADKLSLDKIVKYENFGTALVPYKEYTIEIATARSEEYKDHSRKPKVIKGDLNEDLKRRDFTINSLAMSLNKGSLFELKDKFNGLKDLNNGLVRTPFSPPEIFSEDPLRMLRAIRFATQLDFDIEENTFKAISEVKNRMDIISQERITEELKKILKADNPPSRGFKLMDKSGLLEEILPEIKNMKGTEQKGKYHHKDVFYHTLEVLDNVAEKTDNFKLRFTALVHDIAKPETKEFIEGKGWTFHGHELLGPKMIEDLCKKLKISNEVRDYAMKLSRLHLRPISLADENVTDSAIRRLLVEVEDDLEDLLLLCRCDITSDNPEKIKRYNANFDRVEKRIEKVKERDKLRKFQSPVSGHEIMEYFDLEPGPAVGKIKEYLEEAILDGKIPNEHDATYNYMVDNSDKFREKIKELN